MDAESIKINVTLKLGGKVYAKDKIYHAPFSSDLVAEIRSNSNTITVLKRKQTEEVQFPITKVIPVPKKRRGRKPKS